MFFTESAARGLIDVIDVIDVIDQIDTGRRTALHNIYALLHACMHARSIELGALRMMP
eukprot:COSAG01_NODE_63789_length_278_cov_3.206704_1_plen_58_part_10